MNTVDPASGSLYLTQTHAAQAQAAKDARKQDNIKGTKSFGSLLKTQNEKQAADFQSLDGLPPELMQMSQEEAIVLLKDELDAAGNDITINATPSALERYKKAVTNFVKYIEKNYTTEQITYKAKDRRTGKWGTRQRLLVVAINEKLDKLANDVMYNHLDKIKALKKIGEINGLIIDLLAA